MEDGGFGRRLVDTNVCSHAAGRNQIARGRPAGESTRTSARASRSSSAVPKPQVTPTARRPWACAAAMSTRRSPTIAPGGARAERLQGGRDRLGLGLHVQVERGRGDGLEVPAQAERLEQRLGERGAAWRSRRRAAGPRRSPPAPPPPPGRPACRAARPPRSASGRPRCTPPPPGASAIDARAGRRSRTTATARRAGRAARPARGSRPIAASAWFMQLVIASRESASTPSRSKRTTCDRRRPRRLSPRAWRPAGRRTSARPARPAATASSARSRA